MAYVLLISLFLLSVAILNFDDDDIDKSIVRL